MLNKEHGAVIVSWDFKEGPGVSLVGFQEKGEVTVINEFSGKEAHKLIEKIIDRKES